MTRKTGGKARVVTRAAAEPAVAKKTPGRKPTKKSLAKRFKAATSAAPPQAEASVEDASGEGQAPVAARSPHKALGMQRARKLSEKSGELIELPPVNTLNKAADARRTATASAPKPMSDATIAARRKYMALEAFYPEIADRDPEEIARRTGIDVESVRVFLEQKRLAPAAPVAVTPVAMARPQTAIATPQATVGRTPATALGSQGWRVEFTDGSHGVVLAPSLAAAAAALGARATSVTKVELIGALLNS